METSLPHLNHSQRRSLWLNFHRHEFILKMEKPFLAVLELRNSKNTLKNTWKTIQLKLERMRVESSRCHARNLQNRRRTSSPGGQAAILSRHYVFGRTKHEAGVERDTRATGEGAGKNNKYLCKCKFWQAKSNQSVEKSVNFNDPSLSNHWVTLAFDFIKHNGFLCEELATDTFY